MFAYVLLQLLLKQNSKQICVLIIFLILEVILYWVITCTTQPVRGSQKPLKWA